MRRSISKPTIILLTLLLLAGCERDVITPPLDDTSISAPNEIQTGLRSSEETETVLGSIRQSPYTVPIMTQAWNNLYNESRTSLPVTHYYVKFIPDDADDLLILAEEDIILTDFPLEHEVITMGDYYLQPGKTYEDIPDYYAVVEDDYVFPDVRYDMLDSLVLAPYDSYLTAEAFRLTGNQHRRVIGPQDCVPSCLSYPCCLIEAWQCGDDVTCDFKPPPGCFPGAPDFPWCLELSFTGGPPQTNICGCTMPGNPRTPAGCIRVEDTELGMVGARNVKVIWWDGWFGWKRTWTDESGCFTIDGHSEAGKAYMWTKWKTDEIKISALRGARLWQVLFAVDHYVGKFEGGTYNNVYHEYLDDPDESSAAKRYWSTATTMNAYEEFKEFVADDNIAFPQFTSRLKVILTVGQGRGGAPMLKQGYHEDFLDEIIEIWLFPLISWDEPNLNILTKELPDVTYGYSADDSDLMKATLYHEFGHTLHYASTNNNYWDRARFHIIMNAISGNPFYGEPGNFAFGSDPALMEIVESWGEHIGLTYAHQHYGTNNSLGGSQTYATILENRVFTNFYIPDGLHNDLIDNMVDSGNGVVDNVEGFNNDWIYSVLDPSVDGRDELQDALIDLYLSQTPSTVQQITDLFDSYDW